MFRRSVGFAGRVWIVAGVLLGLVTVAGAQGPRGGAGMPPPGAGGGLPPLFMRVQLTDQQRTQIQPILEEQREARRAEIEERRTLQQQLISAIYGTTAVEADQLSQLVTRLAELQKQALDADIALQTKIAALLTEQQRQQIVEQERARPAAGRR